MRTNNTLEDIRARLIRGEDINFIAQYHGIPVETIRKVFKSK